jgi:hypothetical protein
MYVENSSDQSSDFADAKRWRVLAPLSGFAGDTFPYFTMLPRDFMKRDDRPEHLISYQGSGLDWRLLSLLRRCRQEDYVAKLQKFQLEGNDKRFRQREKFS